MPLQQTANTSGQQRLTRRHEVAVPAPAISHLVRTALVHGAEWLRQGNNLDQIVRDYVYIGLAVAALAVKRTVPIAVVEFPKLNRWL